MQPLPEWVDGARALSVLTKTLEQARKTLPAKVLLADLRESKKNVWVPGFTPFTHAGEFRASDWTVPTRTEDLDEVVAIYEDYVDRHLGTFNCPDRIARRAATGPKGDAFFGRSRSKLEWWIPAVQLVAIASRLSNTPAQVGTNHVVALEADGFRMHVQPEGCWSNSHGRMRTTKHLPQDADIETLTVDGLVTNHPLAQAAVELGLPEGALMAVNAVVRCEMVGRIDKVQSMHLEPRVKRTRGPTKTKTTPADVAGALRALRDEVEAGWGTPLAELQAIAVPALMTGQEFRRTIANGADHPTRPMSGYIAQKLVEYIELREGSLERI